MKNRERILELIKDAIADKETSNYALEQGLDEIIGICEEQLDVMDAQHADDEDDFEIDDREYDYEDEDVINEE